MAVDQNTIYGLYVKCPWCADDGECIVMVHVHCPCQKVRGENNVGREDQRSKCARLLTKF